MPLHFSLNDVFSKLQPVSKHDDRLVLSDANGINNGMADQWYLNGWFDHLIQ